MPELVPTPHGDAQLLVDEAADVRAVLALGHGAGGGPDSRDLVALADSLPKHGVTVVRVVQPYRLAGRRLPPRGPVVDECWTAAVQAFRSQHGWPVPLAVGGRSAGARVACRTAVTLGAVAVVALAFPLHPPGRPERSRYAELAGAGVPTLVVQGERDAFGRPEEFPDGPFERVVVPHANHGLAVPKGHSQPAALDVVTNAVVDWVGNAVGTP